MAERGVVGALRGRMPERLTRQLGVVQLLFKVCSTTQTHGRRSFNISVSKPLHGKHANLLQMFHLPTQEQRSSSSAELNCRPKVCLGPSQGPPCRRSLRPFDSLHRASSQYPTLSLRPQQLRPLSLRLL